MAALVIQELDLFEQVLEVSRRALRLHCEVSSTVAYVSFDDAKKRAAMRLGPAELLRAERRTHQTV